MAVPRISKEDLKTLLDSPDTAPVIVDARLKYPYEHSTATLPGAVRLAPGPIDVSRLPAGREVVAYDSDPDELAAERLAFELMRRGYTVRVLQGGIGDWMTAKLPVDAKSAPQTAPSAPAAKS